MLFQHAMKWLVLLSVLVAWVPLAAAQLNEEPALLQRDEEQGPSLGETHVSYWDGCLCLLPIRVSYRDGLCSVVTK